MYQLLFQFDIIKVSTYLYNDDGKSNYMYTAIDIQN